MARLHRLISVHEFPQSLPRAILTGEACLWCLAPINGTAVDLGLSDDLPLAGCEPCYSARLAWYVSWYDWHEHYQRCVPCQQRRTCYVGHGRRILHEQTTGPADKPQPTCFTCQDPLLRAEIRAAALAQPDHRRPPLQLRPRWMPDRKGDRSVSSPLRPITYWNGMPVPFITAWTKEAVPPQPLAVIHGRGGSGLGFRDEEAHIDRHYGVPWVRMPAVRGGRSDFAAVHALRQRQAMSRLLCQICGGPTVGTRPDERTLFLTGAAGGRPITPGEQTTAPPVHAVCARLAVQKCPPLRDHGWAAALVGYAPTWGVAGQIHHPRTLEALGGDVSQVPFTDERGIRWVLATRLVITLEEVTPVTDLDVLAERELELVRVSR
ncbi:hypothetical protein ACH4PW_13035 [Streptomyces sp. NPDC017082]|uniref:hypothetical protein n=1 Tax=Streptomyces sp. NPDC017082 TaxID=3364974 RepID=UPI0037BB0F8C